ncbi:MAG TPA: hypothetical protein VMV47_13500 [Bacteroidales bacterium]|nr:hypothetical protein [Bacteroidales bacterium]
MYRREFIKQGTIATVTGSAIINGLYMNSLFESTTGIPINIDIPSPYLSKLTVKPVMTAMYHTDVWEGPCRWKGETKEQELKAAANQFEAFNSFIMSDRIDKSIVSIFEAGQIFFVEDFRIKEEEYRKIDGDAKKADVLLINPYGCSVSNFDVAARYNKPVVISSGPSCRTVDVSAYCRSKGIECYIPDEVEDINQIFTLLKARKNFSETRILFPTDWKWPSVCSVAGINEPEKLKEKFGIELVTISYEELSKEMEQTRGDKSSRLDAVKMADTVYSGASRSFIDEKYVASSMEFYQTIVNLMKRYNCNAFTIECFEFCTSRLPQKWNITPCLIHTMLKDLGIPSACEGDLGGLLPMHMLMLLSNKSPHFGNMFYYPDMGNGTMAVNHSVPGIKMNGYDKPGLPYQLSHFVDSGWGTKVIVDFMKNDVKDITVARMDPSGNGILVLKGVLVGSKGWDDETIGCHDIAYMVGKESGTALEFVRKQADYGNHLPWVYGDYSEQLEKLGKLLGINVEVVS